LFPSEAIALDVAKLDECLDSFQRDSAWSVLFFFNFLSIN